jgi:hypothetical protein
VGRFAVKEEGVFWVDHRLSRKFQQFFIIGLRCNFEQEWNFSIRTVDLKQLVDANFKFVEG